MTESLAFDLSVNLGNVLTIAGSVVAIVWRAGKLQQKLEDTERVRIEAEERRDLQLEKFEKTIEKMEATLELVAVQKEQIQTIRDIQLQNTKRADETFSRVFMLLDKLTLKAS